MSIEQVSCAGPKDCMMLWERLYIPRQPLERVHLCPNCLSCLLLLILCLDTRKAGFWNEINICKMLCGLYKHWYRTVTASIFTCPSLDDLIPQPKILAWPLLPPFWRQWNQDTAVHLIIVEQACRASSGSIINHLFWLNGQYLCRVARVVDNQFVSLKGW